MGSWAQLQAFSFAQLVQAIELLGADRGSSAIALYRDWIALQPATAPLLGPAWFNLGVELAHAGLTADAIVAYRQALALQPSLHPAAINLGLALEQCGDPQAALGCWEAALQPDAARIALTNQRARLLETSGRFDEAEQALRKSLLVDPHQPDAIQHWLHLRQKMCCWPVFDESIPGLSRDQIMERCGPLAALALTDDVKVQGATASFWLARKTSPVAERLSPPEGYKSHERIRIGYVSSDFCRHALSYLIAELFERHDRDRFEVFGYCTSRDDGSDVRARVIAAFDHFRSIRDLYDETAARLIRADEIDILVDLNGLTAGSRLQILRWRPAPIQATYLGFVGPVPLPELDYLLCDAFVVPPELAPLYRPTPLVIGPIYQANDSHALPTPTLTRAQAGLPDDRFVFACFSNHYKITESQFSLWMQILHRAPDAILWLIADNPWSVRNLRDRAAQAGIDPARLVFAERASPAEYRARLPLADLFLDTFPYNAGTIASDAIRAGLPILTLMGEAFASRMAARLIKAIGAERGIAVTPGEYVETAIAFASDREAYADYRALFTEERWAATIGNIADFTTALEATLIGICKRGSV